MVNIGSVGFKLHMMLTKQRKMSVLKYFGPVCLDGIPFSVQSSTSVFWPLILFNWAHGCHINVIYLSPSLDDFC